MAPILPLDRQANTIPEKRVEGQSLHNQHKIKLILDIYTQEQQQNTPPRKSLV